MPLKIKSDDHVLREAKARISGSIHAKDPHFELVNFLYQSLEHLAQKCTRLEEQKRQLASSLKEAKFQLSRKDSAIRQKELLYTSVFLGKKAKNIATLQKRRVQRDSANSCAAPLNVFEIPTVHYLGTEKARYSDNSFQKQVKPFEVSRTYMLRRTEKLTRTNIKKYLKKDNLNQLADNNMLERIFQGCFSALSALGDSEEDSTKKLLVKFLHGKMAMLHELIVAQFRVLGSLSQCGRQRMTLCWSYLCETLARHVNCERVQLYYVDSLMRKYRTKDEAEQDRLIPYYHGLVGKCHRQNEEIEFHESNKNYSMPDVSISVSTVSLLCFPICNDIGLPQFVALLTNKRDGGHFEKEDRFYIELVVRALSKDLILSFDNSMRTDHLLEDTTEILLRLMACTRPKELFHTAVLLTSEKFVLSKVAFLLFERGKIIKLDSQTEKLQESELCGIAGRVKAQNRTEVRVLDNMNQHSQFNSLTDIDTSLPVVLVPVSSRSDDSVFALFQFVNYSMADKQCPFYETKLHNSLRVVGLCVHSLYCTLKRCSEPSAPAVRSF